MPYREITIGKETFITRLTPDALEEWKEVRERNRHIGYPDRPPDVDTPLHRGWISHPNEVNKFALLSSELNTGSFPIYSISCEKYIDSIGAIIEGKLLISYDAQKDSCEFRHVARTLEGLTIGDTSFYASWEDAEAIFDDELESFARVFVVKNIDPFISTFIDYEALLEETEIAEKELKEYYGETKPRMVN